MNVILVEMGKVNHILLTERQKVLSVLYLRCLTKNPSLKLFALYYLPPQLFVTLSVYILIVQSRNPETATYRT
jgi:hypothetical protein